MLRQSLATTIQASSTGRRRLQLAAAEKQVRPRRAVQAKPDRAQAVQVHPRPVQAAQVRVQLVPAVQLVRPRRVPVVSLRLAAASLQLVAAAWAVAVAELDAVRALVAAAAWAEKRVVLAWARPTWIVPQRSPKRARPAKASKARCAHSKASIVGAVTRSRSGPAPTRLLQAVAAALRQVAAASPVGAAVSLAAVGHPVAA